MPSNQARRQRERYIPGTQTTTPEERQEIRHLRFVERRKVKQIAEAYNIGASTVSAICNASEDGTYTHNRGTGKASGPRFDGPSRDFPYPRSTGPEQANRDYAPRDLPYGRTSIEEPAPEVPAFIRDRDGRLVPSTPTGDALKARIEFHRETLAALELLDAMSPEARAEIMKVLR